MSSLSVRENIGGWHCIRRKQCRNEAALTGESIPVDKTVGDSVSAATVNQSGFIRCEATRVGEDTTLSQIIQMVSDAAATKAPDRKGCRQGIRYVCTDCYYHCSHYKSIVWLLGQSVGFAPARAFLFWSSAVRAHWASRPWLPLWWATAWAQSTVLCLRLRVSGGSGQDGYCGTG